MACTYSGATVRPVPMLAQASARPVSAAATCVMDPILMKFGGIYFFRCVRLAWPYTAWHGRSSVEHCLSRTHSLHRTLQCKRSVGRLELRPFLIILLVFTQSQCAVRCHVTKHSGTDSTSSVSIKCLVPNITNDLIFVVMQRSVFAPWPLMDATESIYAPIMASY